MDTILDFGQHIALGAAGACFVIILWIMAEGVVHHKQVVKPDTGPWEDHQPPLRTVPDESISQRPPSPDSLKSLFFTMHNHGQITAVVSRPDALRKLKGQARYKVDLVGMETFLRYVALASGWVEG